MILYFIYLLTSTYLRYLSFFLSVELFFHIFLNSLLNSKGFRNIYKNGSLNFITKVYLVYFLYYKRIFYVKVKRFRKKYILILLIFW